MSQTVAIPLGKVGFGNIEKEAVCRQYPLLLTPFLSPSLCRWSTLSYVITLWSPLSTIHDTPPGSVHSFTRLYAGWLCTMKLKDAPWKESYDQPRQHIKSQRHYFSNRSPSSQGYGFPSGHEWMWELDYKESWVPKNWCFWTVVLEKTLESPLDCKEIQPVHPKGQSWVFIGRTDVEAETPIFWPLDVESWFIWKDPDAGKDWGQEEKGMTEDEMVGWHHWHNGHGFGWTLGVGDGPRASVHGVAKSWTWLSDWTELTVYQSLSSPHNENVILNWVLRNSKKEKKKTLWDRNADKLVLVGEKSMNKVVEVYSYLTYWEKGR